MTIHALNRVKLQWAGCTKTMNNKYGTGVTSIVILLYTCTFSWKQNRGVKNQKFIYFQKEMMISDAKVVYAQYMKIHVSSMLAKRRKQTNTQETNKLPQWLH